jgi:competence protein ComEC
VAGNGDQFQSPAPEQEAPPPQRHRPLVPVLIGFCLGIALDNAATPAVWVWAAAAAVTLAATLGATWRGLAPRWNYLLAVLLLAPAGGLYHDLRFRHTPSYHLQHLTLTDGELYYLRGRVTQEPQRYYRAAPFAADDETPAVFYVMKLELAGVSGDGATWRRAAGGLTVFINSAAGGPQVGDRVEFLAKVDRNSPPSNPGQRDTALAYAREGSYGTASVPSTAGIRILGRAPWYSPSAAVGRLRSWLDRRLEGVLGQGEDAGLVRALLFGEQNALTPRQADLLRESGTLQFLAISGLHVGILCVFVISVFTLAGVPVRLRALLTIAVVWLYVLFTGFHVSAIRAGWMISLVLAAPLLGRRRDSLSALAGAALLILLYQPQQLFSAGFQLTFIAVWAMVCIYPQLHGIFWPWEDLLADAESADRPSVLAEAWLYARSYLLLSVTVWLATAPVLVFHFNLLCFLAPLLNLVIWPLVLMLLLVCFALAGSVVLAGIGAGALAAVAALLSRDVQVLLGAASRLPGYGVYLPTPPVWWIGLYYLALSGWVMRWRTRWGRVSFIAAVLVLAMTYVGNDAVVRSHRDFRLTLVDVGHGQAALAEAPSGETVLFDAGTEGGGRARAQALAEVLWRRHIDRIDALCISHMNEDHLSFLPYLARRFSIAKVIVPQAGDVNELGAALRNWVRGHGIELEAVGEGVEIRAGALIGRVLHPNVRFVTGATVPENSKSLVLWCACEGLSVLLPGDVEDDALRRLCTDCAAGLAADLLVVPHHGACQLSLGEFVDLVRPRIALVSAPSAEADADTEALLRARGISLWITGREGAIIVSVRGGRARVLGWKSGRTMEFVAPSAERNGDG